MRAPKANAARGLASSFESCHLRLMKRYWYAEFVAVDDAVLVVLVVHGRTLCYRMRTYVRHAYLGSPTKRVGCSGLSHSFALQLSPHVVEYAVAWNRRCCCRLWQRTAEANPSCDPKLQCMRHNWLIPGGIGS
jgi:hypothetical protein